MKKKQVSPEWKKLETWYNSVRRDTLRSFGMTEKEIYNYMKRPEHKDYRKKPTK